MSSSRTGLSHHPHFGALYGQWRVGALSKSSWRSWAKRYESVIPKIKRDVISTWGSIKRASWIYETRRLRPLQWVWHNKRLVILWARSIGDGWLMITRYFSFPTMSYRVCLILELMEQSCSFWTLRASAPAITYLEPHSIASRGDRASGSASETWPDGTVWYQRDDSSLQCICIWQSPALPNGICICVTLYRTAWFGFLPDWGRSKRHTNRWTW